MTMVMTTNILTCRTVTNFVFPVEFNIFFVDFNDVVCLFRFYYALCDATNIPAIVLNMSGNQAEQVQLSIPGSALLDLYFQNFINGQQWCALTLQSSGGSMWVLGDPVLRSYYTVYDYSNARIGFATLK